MKRRAMSLFLAVVMCMCVSGSAFAQAREMSEMSGAVVTRGAVGLSCGLTKVSGNTYEAWAGARAAVPEQITVGFALYSVVNNTETYITSANNSGYGLYVEACDTVILTAGKYKLYAYFEGETVSNGTVKTYTIG